MLWREVRRRLLAEIDLGKEEEEEDEEEVLAIEEVEAEREDVKEEKRPFGLDTRG